MAAMIPTPFDWSRLIAEMTDESFGIPPDVTFQIEENGQLHEVKAHKTILGMVSSTFKTMFYATNVGEKTANVIKIEETTAPAFQIMMDAVYNVKSIEASLVGKSVHEVFDVVILVERYQIVELMEAVKEHLGNYPITDDTVLVVAEEAKEFTNMFEAEAQQLLRTCAKDLLLTCAKFLKTKLKDLNAVTRYAAEHEDRGEVLATLLARMNVFAPTECVNCKKEICQDGEIIKGVEFREGLLVTNNRATGYWGKNVNFMFGALCLTGLSLAYDVPWMVSSTPSKGGHWTGKIYFNPDLEVSSREANCALSTNLKEPDLRPHWISDFELKEKLKHLVDDSEKIEKIWLYKKPLGEWQYTSALLYHAYVVLETNRLWWSLEKNAEGLTLQRAKFPHTVVHYYRQKKRLNTEYWVPQLIIEDEGRMTMNDLVDFLYDKDFLNKPYNWKSNNCKHFAKAIFDRVAKTKYWDSI